MATGLGDLSIATYTGGGALGLFTTRPYGTLIEKAERGHIISILESQAARGKTLQDVITLLHRF